MICLVIYLPCTAEIMQICDRYIRIHRNAHPSHFDLYTVLSTGQGSESYDKDPDLNANFYDWLLKMRVCEARILRITIPGVKLLDRENLFNYRDSRIEGQSKILRKTFGISG